MSGVSVEGDGRLRYGRTGLIEWIVSDTWIMWWGIKCRDKVDSWLPVGGVHGSRGKYDVFGEFLDQLRHLSASNESPVGVFEACVEGGYHLAVEFVLPLYPPKIPSPSITFSASFSSALTGAPVEKAMIQAFGFLWLPNSHSAALLLTWRAAAKTTATRMDLACP